MNEPKQATGFEAGLSGDDQIRVALQCMIECGGEARMPDIYEAVEARIRPKGFALSKQGRASLRFFVNKVAVQAGYVYPHDKENPGWRITPEGKEFAGTPVVTEEVAVNVDTGAEVQLVSNSAQGAAFERWVLILLRAAYPYYAWYDQGRHKGTERGLDFVGTRLGDSNNEARSIGVQVKLHQPNNAPTQAEWLKFLAGCFARRVESAIFVTTGRLTGEQRREAQEAKVIVLEGAVEISRLAMLHNVEAFELSEQGADEAAMTTASTDKPDWGRVVALLPEVEAQDFKPGIWHSQPGEMPYFEASATTERLVRALYESGVVYDFDWGEWQDHAEHLVQDERTLAEADLSTLRKLLTLHVRKDRFCEGHLAEMLESGHLAAILRRVASLRSELVRSEDNTAG